MSKRREFPRKVKDEIILRASGADGIICCEGCGLVLGRKPFQIDHTVAEELVIDKSKPLTAADGKLLGVECCHKPKTADDVRQIRKSDRQRDKHTGAVRPAAKIKSAGFPKSPKAERVTTKTQLPYRSLYKEIDA